MRARSLQNSVPDGVDYDTQEFRTRGLDAYNNIMSDAQQKNLYEFFIAMNILGMTSNQSHANSDMLKSSYVADAKQYLVDLLEKQEQTHKAAAQTAASVATGYYLSSLFFWAIPGGWAAAAMLDALAIGLGIESGNQRHMATVDNDYQTNLNTQITNAFGTSGLVTTAAQALSDATVGSGGYSRLRANLDNEIATLDAMLGRTSGAAVTTTAITSAILAAVSKQDLADILALANTGIADPSQRLDLPGLIDRYLGSATSAAHPATDAATALNDMLYDAQTRREAASADLEQGAGALAATQLANEQAYQKALNDLRQVPLADPEHPSDAYRAAETALQEAARRAYLNPAYRTSDHVNRLLGLEQSLQAEVDPRKHPELDRAQQDLLSSQGQALAALWQDRMKSYMAVQEQRWALMQEDLQTQQSQWQASMETILKRAETQWETAFDALETQHTNWQSAFATAYQDRAAAWDASYAKLETGKAGWVQDAATKAASIGSEAVLGQLGQSAEGAIRDARSIVVSDLGISAPDARAAVAGILEGKDFASLLASGKLLNRGISSAGSVVFAQLGPDVFDSSHVLSLIREMNGLSMEEIDKHVLMITAAEARKAVADAAVEMNRQIDDANQSVADGLERSLLEAGFVRSGGDFQRQTVVDSTINGPLTETHVVPAYRPFVPDAEIASKVDLSDATLLQLSAAGIQAQVELAIKDMRGQLEGIFGKQGDTGTTEITSWKNVTVHTEVTDTVSTVDSEGNRHTSQVTTVRESTRRDASSTAASIGAGKFGLYVGIAPKMESENLDATAEETEYSKYLSATGSGELGRVLTPFMWSQMKAGMGWAMAARPAYDQKLWDDRNSWVKAPTLRSVADIGVSVVGTVIAGPAGAAIAGLVEKGLFTVADLANRQMSLGEGLVSLGKDILSTAFSMAMGGLGDTVTKGLDAVGGLSGIIGKTIWSGAQGFTTNMGQGLINNITYSSNKGFGFDGQAFAQSVVGQQALAGYLGGMASTATSSSLGQWNLKDGNGITLNGHVFDTQSIQSFNGLMGSAVSAGIQYGMTGEATLNVANFSMLGIKGADGEIVQNGLLEMHLGGSNGFSMNLGTGGADFSLGNIASAIQGVSESAAISKWKYGSSDDRAVLNAVNGLGYTDSEQNWNVAQRIFSRDLAVQFSSQMAQNEWGSYSTESPNTITLNADMLNAKGALGAAEMASVLSHEGTHASGNRVEGIAYIMQMDAMYTISKAWGVSDSAFSNSIARQAMVAGNWEIGAGGEEHAKFSGNEGSNDPVGIVPDNLWDSAWKGLLGPALKLSTGGFADAADTISGGQLSEWWYANRTGKDIFDERDYNPAQGLISMILMGSALSQGIKAGVSGAEVLLDMVNPASVMKENLWEKSSFGAAMLTGLAAEDFVASGRDLYDSLEANLPEMMKGIKGMENMDKAVFSKADALGVPLNTQNIAYDPETIGQIQDAAKERYVVMAEFIKMGTPDDLVKQYFFGGIQSKELVVGQGIDGSPGAKVMQFVQEDPGMFDAQRKRFWDLPPEFTAGDAFDKELLRKVNLENAYDISAQKSLSYSSDYLSKVINANDYWNRKPGQYEYWRNYLNNESASYNAWIQKTFGK